MKLAAVYDNDGRILAGIIDDGRYDRPRPLSDDKTQGGIFEVPQAADQLSLAEICTTYRVDPGSKQLMRSKG